MKEKAITFLVNIAAGVVSWIVTHWLAAMFGLALLIGLAGFWTGRATAPCTPCEDCHQIIGDDAAAPDCCRCRCGCRRCRCNRCPGPKECK